MFLDPEDPAAPKFWVYETSGVLRPVIEKYLQRQELAGHEVATFRAYIRQWIMSPVWGGGPELDVLRDMVESLTTQAQIERWLDKAMDLGIDPL